MSHSTPPVLQADLNSVPLNAASRELIEETGYAGKVQFATTCSDDAYSTRLRYCFVATECRLTKEQQLDSTESIAVELMPLPDFRQLLRSGRMTDVEIGYLGLDFLHLL